MTRTLTQPLAADAARHSRHFQLIVDVHLLLLNQGEVLLGRRANTGYGDGAYEPPSGPGVRVDGFGYGARLFALERKPVKMLPDWEICGCAALELPS